jgi:hypothetical protein
MVEIPIERADTAVEQTAREIDSAKDASYRNRLVFYLVFVGFIISGLIALMIIGGVIWISIENAGRGKDNQINIPEVLQNWGGVVVGFYFGAFVTLIKDFIKM